MESDGVAVGATGAAVANKGLGGVLAERPVPGRKRPVYMLGDADVPIL